MRTNNRIDFELPLAVQIRKQIVKAISDFQLLEPNDKIMVCVSGGKDSSILLALLTEIQRRAEFDFHIEAAILDQKQPGFDGQKFYQWVNDLGVQLHILERDTYSIVKEKIPEGNTYCSLCSRLRRAILYDFAADHGFTKMAMGHHRDDVITTSLLNLFFIGQTATMPPKLLSDDQRNIVIRPMTYVSERDLIELGQQWDIPVIPCNLCGSQDGLKRKKIKQLIYDLEKEIPNICQSILTAATNVKPSHLMDQNLWNFKDLKVAEKPNNATEQSLPIEVKNNNL